MSTQLFAEPKVELYPRDYQQKAHDESFRLWEGGERGVLDRIFTGGGKTPLACMNIRAWLERGPQYHAMIVSYERDLVWQFAQEVHDFLGIDPGIEMADDTAIVGGQLPRVSVVSRASLLPVDLLTADQARDLLEYGISDVLWLPRRHAKTILAKLAADADRCEEAVRDQLERLRGRYQTADGRPWSRLHKFDWRLHWLIIFDEAHRHAKSLKSVGHIVDWFDQNPLSRRLGLTATPKRGDGISIGHKMFPGVAIDYPLFHASKPCAVTGGWAVPYLQKYIEVEGVDFKDLPTLAGDYDEAQLEQILGTESALAKLVQPLLDQVGDRRTLIFSPGVEMAKNVAAFINARCELCCPACQKKQWHPLTVVGDGAQCSCGQLLASADITKEGMQARSINGATPPRERKAAYQAHQAGKYQFLSVCGLCREGYNDPDISCVAVFRPVSKKASSLAEQMKGRACRPCRSIVPTLNALITPEERVEAIAQSEKPNALIVDLVGITGLADCASTVQIYADGLEDDVEQRATEILEAEEGDVAAAIKRAQDEIAAEREAQERRRQEEAERRAKARAEVRYSEHEVGVGSNVDPDRASEAQYKFMRFLGMKVKSTISKRRANRLIEQLKLRTPCEEVARLNRLAPDEWETVGPSPDQLHALARMGIQRGVAKTGWDATQIIGAQRNPAEYERRKIEDINRASHSEELTAVGRDLLFAKLKLPADVYVRLVEAGRVKRASMME